MSSLKLNIDEIEKIPNLNDKIGEYFKLLNLLKEEKDNIKINIPAILIIILLFLLIVISVGIWIPKGFVVSIPAFPVLVVSIVICVVILLVLGSKYLKIENDMNYIISIAKKQDDKFLYTMTESWVIKSIPWILVVVGVFGILFPVFSYIKKDSINFSTKPKDLNFQNDL